MLLDDQAFGIFTTEDAYEQQGLEVERKWRSLLEAFTRALGL